MKKILVRSGVSPTDSYNPSKLIIRNLIGNNVGNLIYQYGIFRTLNSKKIQAISDNYTVERGRITNQDIEKINKNFIAYVCPLADAIRETYIKKLDLYIDFIEKLEIPFIVSGIGVKTDIHDDGTGKFPYDEDVSKFIKAVTENGTIIGVRGNTTGNYLSNLGFKENKDFMVIGCPSMFSCGTHIKIREKKINENSLVSINSSLMSPKTTLQFISNLCQKYPNHYFIPQWLSEFKLTYLGRPDVKTNEEKRKFYPTTIKSLEYRNNKVRFPVNAYGWIELLKNVDLSFGARLHGNIAATLGGTPNIMIIKDGRMKDVAEYHELTNITEEKLKKYGSLEEIIETTDFHSTEKNHEKRFEKYLNFWERNDIPTLYDENFYQKDSPIDKKIQLSSKLPVETITKQNKGNRIKEYRKERNKWNQEKKFGLFENRFNYNKISSSIKNKISNFIKKQNKSNPK